MELEKITGMTEHVFSGIGNVDLFNLPPIFLEFVTRISLHLVARVTHMLITAKNTAIIKTVFNTATAVIFPNTNTSLRENRSDGNVDRIFVHSKMDDPLPTSIQSKNVLIPIRVTTPTLQTTDAIITVAKVYDTSKPLAPSPAAIATDWITASVIANTCVIFLKCSIPVFPSFWSSSSDGNTTVMSCMIMEAVIYGLIDKAKNDICCIEPPVMELRKASPWIPKIICI